MQLFVKKLNFGLLIFYAKPLKILVHLITSVLTPYISTCLAIHLETS